MKKLEFKLLVCCALVAVCAIAVKGQTKSKTDGPTHGKGHGQHHEHAQPDKTAQPSTFRLSIPDVEVLNQDGQRVKLYTDLIKGRRVVINFIYTTCKAVCPLSGDNFARLQAHLGEGLGKDVYMLSITTDPENDTPVQLKNWSQRYHPKAGWTFVTGDATAMNAVLRALTGEGARRGYHNPVAFVVDDERGAWKRTNGLEAPAKLVEMLDELSVQGTKSAK